MVFLWLWRGGALLLLAHMLAAFHWRHNWSHAAAYADTARQTREVTGIDWGGGVYFNYALLGLWLAEAFVWPPDLSVRQPRARNWLAGYYAFMWFNATVIFGHGIVPWLGALAFADLAVLAWKRRSSAITATP